MKYKIQDIRSDGTQLRHLSIGVEFWDVSASTHPSSAPYFLSKQLIKSFNTDMNFIKTEIDGVIVIEPKVVTDGRGYFMEESRQNVFDENNRFTKTHA